MATSLFGSIYIHAPHPKVKASINSTIANIYVDLLKKAERPNADAENANFAYGDNEELNLVNIIYVM